MMALANVTIQAAPISKKSLALCNPPRPRKSENNPLKMGNSNRMKFNYYPHVLVF